MLLFLVCWVKFRTLNTLLKKKREQVSFYQHHTVTAGLYVHVGDQGDISAINQRNTLSTPSEHQRQQALPHQNGLLHRWTVSRLVHTARPFCFYYT